MPGVTARRCALAARVSQFFLPDDPLPPRENLGQRPVFGITTTPAGALVGYRRSYADTGCSLHKLGSVRLLA